MEGIRISKESRGKSLLALPDDYTVIDLETTGLSTIYDEIIELAGLKVRNGAVVDDFQQLIKPAFPISDFITGMTGISNEMVKNAPSVGDMIGEFTDWIGDDVVVGHNVLFDVNFIYDASVICLDKAFTNDYINTVRIARRLVRDLPSYRLCELCRYYDINVEGAHRALCDCLMTNELFCRIKREIHEKNLGELMLAPHGIKRYYSSVDARLFTSQIPPEEQDSSHPLYGKVICITGTLERYTRAQAMQMIVNIGGINANSVTKKTDYLVLGCNDYNPLVKEGKSGKQRKAEAYALSGTGISIMDEHTFYDLIQTGE